MHTLQTLLSWTSNPAVTPFGFSKNEATAFAQTATESLSVEELHALARHIDAMPLAGNAAELRDMTSRKLTEDKLRAHKEEMLQYARDLASASEIIRSEYNRGLDDLRQREETDAHHFLMETIADRISAGPYKHH